MVDTAPTPDKKKSIFKLIGDVPTLVRDLVMGELALLKAELLAKLKILGLGIGLILGAVLVLLFFVGVLLTGIVLLIAIWLPGWLSALIVAFFLLIGVAILAWLGIREVKKAMPPVPEKTIQSVKRDVNAIKGVGKRAKA